MPRITRLPAALAARGLTVELVDGWEARGSADFDPQGAVCHWTAGARTGDRPSLKVVRDGRPKLPGPLANVFLARSGVAVVVAAGRANHAGEGGWRGLTGNRSVWGTEAESAGDGDWTDAQRWAYPRINAAYCDLSGFGPDMVCGHNEWAPDRKIDIRDWDMARMRTQIAAVLHQEDDMAGVDTDRLNDAVDRILGILPQRYDAAGKPARVLDTLDGQTLRADIAASTKRTVAETSAAYHQLVALVSGQPGTDLDPGAFADAVLAAVGDDLAGAFVDALADRLNQKG
ncbi:N-acetylmuramoyl-L-alanine amidase [Cellulosimicrobium sp. 22601]|uniref:N-acetylmuramoyl-L-alanine amidase n=1 Tax=unclassified Cellulosimicrobium TaxID=2624466 RepID=UPI003F86D070